MLFPMFWYCSIRLAILIQILFVFI
jgi:hypothetical protein